MKEVRVGVARTRRQMVLGVFLWIAILGAAMFYLLRWVDRGVHVAETSPQSQPLSNAAAELGMPFDAVPEVIATEFLADCWAMIRAQPGFEAGRGTETDSLEDIQGQGRILVLVHISGNRIQLDRLQEYVPVGLDRAQAQRVYATATRAIRTCGIAENMLPNGSYVFTFDPAATEIVVGPATPSHRVASAVHACWTAGNGLAGSVTVAVRTDQDRVVVDQVGNQQNPVLFQAARRAVLRCVENADLSAAETYMLTFSATGPVPAWSEQAVTALHSDD